MTQLYSILKTSKLGAGAAPDMYTALLAQKINKGGSGGEAELSGVPPLTFRSNGTPLIDLLISGNEEHTGTPTPDSPVMPQGTGDRTGNLFASEWESGNINSTTGQNEPSGTVYHTKDYIPVTPNTIYSMKRSIYTGYINVRFYKADKTYIGSGSSSTINIIVGSRASNPMLDGVEFCVFELIDTDIAYMRINDNSNNVNTQYMMVEGQYTPSTMPDYEPYGYKIPISSPNTTTNIYLGEVQTTRKIRKYEFTGEEDWTQFGAVSNTFYTVVSGYLRQRGVVIAICSHYTSQANINGAAEMQDGNVAFYANAGQPWEYFYVRDSNLATVADLKVYLQQQYAAGTPVTVWYVLANEETGIVNEPLMKIGDYVDTLSMEQAGVSIPTNNGSTTVDVGTTVKPSEVYIKYHTR